MIDTLIFCISSPHSCTLCRAGFGLLNQFKDYSYFILKLNCKIQITNKVVLEL